MSCIIKLDHSRFYIWSGQEDSWIFVQVELSTGETLGTGQLDLRMADESVEGELHFATVGWLNGWWWFQYDYGSYVPMVGELDLRTKVPGIAEENLRQEKSHEVWTGRDTNYIMCYTLDPRELELSAASPARRSTSEEMHGLYKWSVNSKDWTGAIWLCLVILEMNRESGMVSTRFQPLSKPSEAAWCSSCLRLPWEKR